MTFHKGDRVNIRIGDVNCDGWVTLASGNSRSLMLSFEAILLGHVGMMAVLLEDDGVFRSIVSGDEVQLQRIDPP